MRDTWLLGFSFNHNDRNHSDRLAVAEYLFQLVVKRPRFMSGEFLLFALYGENDFWAHARHPLRREGSGQEKVGQSHDCAYARFMNTKPHFNEEPSFRGGTEIKISRSMIVNAEADFAMELMRHLAIAIGHPDGEDSAGRAKLRLMTPQEISNRACEISRCAFDEFEKNDWLVALPAPKPMKLKDEL